jgi:cytochrome o ubiquinol oxidase subunit IV
MSKGKVIVSSHELSQAKYKSYVIGFGVSLACTLSAYLLVINHLLSANWALALIVGGLALIQAIVQLTLFLHLGQEAKPKFKLLVFGFMLSVVIILISGSIWIMYSLNYRMMTPSRINNYMQSQDDGGL